MYLHNSSLVIFIWVLIKSHLSFRNFNLRIKEGVMIQTEDISTVQFTFLLITSCCIVCYFIHKIRSELHIFLYNPPIPHLVQSRCQNHIHFYMITGVNIHVKLSLKQLRGIHDILKHFNSLFLSKRFCNFSRSINIPSLLFSFYFVFYWEFSYISPLTTSICSFSFFFFCRRLTIR